MSHTRRIAILTGIVVALLVFGIVMLVQGINVLRQSSYIEGYNAGAAAGFYRGINIGFQCGSEGGCEGEEVIRFLAP